MKGVRFYLEHSSLSQKRSGQHDGTVFAAFVDQKHDGCVDGLGALYAYPDSPVCSTSASYGYLMDCCKRIPEARAREIHPSLFSRLDKEF
jgi:hypothetical protein